MIKNSNVLSFESFKKNPPKTIKVHDYGLRKNIILDYVPSENRYVTRRNMGTRQRRIYHYWSLENAYTYLVN